MHATATIAANSVETANPSREMPDIAVPVWFWHYGTYGGVTGEYGHVVIWVPGRGFLSSPVSGFGQLWLSSIEAVERTFNAKYRFWSRDINTLYVANYAPEPKPLPTQRKGQSDMFLCKYAHAAGEGQLRYAFFGPKFWLELKTAKAVETFKAQLGISKDNVAAYAFDCESEANWIRFQKVTGLSDDEIVHI